MVESFRNACTPPRPKNTSHTSGKQSASTEKRPSKQHDIYIEKLIKFKHKTYELIIETGRLDAGPNTLSVRLQTNNIKIQDQNSPNHAPQKAHWTGWYGGSSTNQSLRYAEPGTSNLMKICAIDTVRYFKVTGNFISNPNIPGDIKAQTIINIITNRNNIYNKTVTPPTKGIANEIHLTRLLENSGFDLIIGQENDENPKEVECIILNPSKFKSENIATVRMDNRGEVLVTSKRSPELKSNILDENTVLLNMQEPDNIRSIPRRLFEGFKDNDIL